MEKCEKCVGPLGSHEIDWNVVRGRSSRDRAMVLILLPTGGREQLTGKRTFGRGIPPSLSDPLISRQQFELDCVCDGVVQLTNIGLNPIIVERPSDTQPAADSLNLSGAATAASASSWHVTDLLEKGDSACLQPNCRFYLAALQESTTFTVISDSSILGAGSADQDDLAAQLQQPHQQGSNHQSRADQEAADAALAAALAAEEQEEDEQQQQWQDGSSDEGSGAVEPAAAPPPPAAAVAAVAVDADMRPAKRSKLSIDSGAAAGAQSSGAAAGASSSGAIDAAVGAGSGAAAGAVPEVGSGPFSLLAVRGLSAAYNTGFLGAQLNQLVVSGAGDSGTGTGGNRLVFALASNYMVDMGWLLSACPQLTTADKVLVVHGHSDHDRVASIISEAAAAGLTPPRFAQHAPPLPITFGTYHSKGFILGYEDGSVRVIVHTANYIYADCNNKTQGLWYQDFPPKDAESPGSSQFEDSLLDYLSCLRLPDGWSSDVMSLVKGADFSSSRVALVASVPGYHTGPTKVNAYGHMRLRALLSETPIPGHYKQAPCIIQCSSLGSLDERWLKQEFMASLTAGKYVVDDQTVPAAAAGGGGVADPTGTQVSQRDSQSRATPSPAGSSSKKASTAAAASSNPAAAAAVGGGVGGNAFALMAAASRAQGAAAAVAGGPTVDVPLYVIWPSKSEVQHSREGWAAGYSIPGPAKNVTKPFLQRYWCRFDGAPVGRRSAMPHIKTYGRFLTHQQPTQQPQGTLNQGAAAAAGASASVIQRTPGQSAADVAGSSGSSCGSGDAELCWWLVTSHNLSKAAWGSLQVCSRGPHRGQPQLMIRSYELGVITTPQLEEAYLRHRHRSYSCTLPSHQSPGASSSLQLPGLLQEQDPQALIPKVQFLAWNNTRQGSGLATPGIEAAAAASSCSVKQVYLPVPYPLPPQRYSADDQPWCVDVQFLGLDSFGFACGDAPFKAYGNKQPVD